MLENIEKPELDTVELRSDGKYGKFVLAPLERGYGITLGNSLRRVLLSSLPGVAVNSVKIDGVHHELSTIPGVKEDVSEIILNLKGLTAKLYGEGPKTIYIEKEGECEVTAADFKNDSEVCILDPGMHIATLGKDARLYMEVVIDRGRGYVSAERNKQIMNSPIDVIAVDSIYTPVLKVNYQVEDTRLGQVTEMRWSSTTNTRPSNSCASALAVSQEPLSPAVIGKCRTASWVSKRLAHRDVMTSGEGWEVLTSALALRCRKKKSGVQVSPS